MDCAEEMKKLGKIKQVQNHAAEIHFKSLERVKARFVPPTSPDEARDRKAVLVAKIIDLQSQLSSPVRETDTSCERYLKWRRKINNAIKYIEIDLLLINNWIKEFNIKKIEASRKPANYNSIRLQRIFKILCGNKINKLDSHIRKCSICGYSGYFNIIETVPECPLCCNGSNDPWKILKSIQHAVFAPMTLTGELIER